MSAELKKQEIRYIGHKEFKKDTVAGSKTMWLGHGDVQEVEPDVAVKLRQHPDVWQPAADEFTPGEATAPTEAVVDASVNGGGDSLEGIPSEGKSPIDLAVAAIDMLDPDNPEHTTQKGAPKKAVVEQMLGFKLDKAQWASVMQTLKAEQDSEE